MKWCWDAITAANMDHIFGLTALQVLELDFTTSIGEVCPADDRLVQFDEECFSRILALRKLRRLSVVGHVSQQMLIDIARLPALRELIIIMVGNEEEYNTSMFRENVKITTECYQRDYILSTDLRMEIESEKQLYHSR